MKKTEITLIKLTSSKGKIVTNGEIYGKEIYLACNDSAENYHEITDAEFAEIAAKEEAESNV